MLKSKTRRFLDAAKASSASLPLIYDRHKGSLEAQNLLKVLRDLARLGAEETDLKQALRDVLAPWHAKICQTHGRYETTVHIATNEGTLQVQFKQQYGKIPAEREQELRAELGDDFDVFFEERAAVVLRRDVAEDEDKLDAMVSELRQLLGDRFSDYFTAERCFVPTKEFTQKCVLDPVERERLGIKQVVSFQEKREKKAA